MDTIQYKVNPPNDLQNAVDVMKTIVYTWMALYSMADIQRIFEKTLAQIILEGDETIERNVNNGKENQYFMG